ncbi:MAG: 4-alpha-glucanotransferase [Verrucomicrobia bacterium]|nr:4-alpha-glucanotransferase [Verrucomicrobiota bacterium]
MIVPALPPQITTFPTKLAWDRIGFRHHHGINVPLFSLRTQEGSGIGEFLDLIPLIAWCKEIGFDVIQLLPINDTGLEASPYNGLSSLALHPIYLSLWDLPHLSKHKHLEKRLLSLRKLNDYPSIPFSLVLVSKMDFLKEYYLATFAKLKEEASYQEFIQKERWLSSYALFKVCKDRSFYQPWHLWPPSFKENTAALEELNFHIFLQYLCFQQFAKVKRAAIEACVFLKGDLPILLSPESADVWHHPQEFDLSFEAGAPPDMFAPLGQRWGFPTYKWDVIQENGYRFWKDRLKVASELYDIFRIDHIIGFFRIWALPRSGGQEDGLYIPAVEEEMLLQGETILTNLCETLPMLPIGEDLGLGIAMPEIRASLEKLGIPGTKIPRWEKKEPFYTSGKEFSPLSLTSVSTHDSETLSLWWQHFPNEAELFALSRGIRYQSTLTSDIRFQILEDSHHSGSLFHINLLLEYLALFPDLVHKNPEHERINVPGTISTTNWCYRMRPTIKELTHHHSLKMAMKALLPL